MLGRYQQRVGVYTAGDGGRGFDPTLPIFPSFLPQDYVSTVIGKWDLGLDRDYPEQGKWKLHSLKGKQELFDLVADPSETKNLIAENRALAERLSRLHSEWLREMAPPITGGPKSAGRNE